MKIAILFFLVGMSAHANDLIFTSNQDTLHLPTAIGQGDSLIFSFSINNQTHGVQWYLATGPYAHTELRVLKGPGDAATQTAGWKHPAKRGHLLKGLRPSPLIPLPLSGQGRYVFELRVWEETHTDVSAPQPFLLNERFLHGQKNLSPYFQGFFLGALLLLLAYHLIGYWIVRDRGYLYFLVFGIFNGLIWYSAYGYAFEFLWPQWPRWNLYSLWVAILVQSLGFIAFIRHVLELSKKDPLFDKWLYRLMWLNPVIYFLTPSLSGFILGVYGYSFLACAFLLIVIGRSLMAGERQAKILALALILFLGLCLVSILAQFGIFPLNSFTVNSTQVASLIQLFLFSIGLADRINTLKREKEILRENLNQALEKEVEERTRDLRRALRGQEVLLREIHHRVKNNLQIIFSLLDIQEDSLMDSSARDAFEKSKSRILSISAAHEQLHLSRESDAVQSVDYFPRLCSHIRDAFLPSNNNVKLRMNIEPITLPLDAAVPLGLILNELVTNAFKHGIKPSEHSGEIHVSLNRNAQKQLHLQVKDNGPGTGSAGLSAFGIGLRLVEDLARQLGGQLKIRENAGCEVNFTFNREI